MNIIQSINLLILFILIFPLIMSTIKPNNMPNFSKRYLLN